MKIFFFSPCALDPKLGAAKMLMELSSAMEKLGWSATLMGPPDLGADRKDGPAKLHAYLAEHADEYDVIDFDYKYLNLRRSEFSDRILFVARAQLLLHHYVFSPMPPVTDVRGGLRLLKHQVDRFRKWRTLPALDATFREADLVSVLNRHARRDLARRGVDAEKILVFPNGMSEERRPAFERVPVAPPPDPVVAFIGMFGPRKGSADLPDIVRRVTDAVPGARFRLLGTRGMFRTEAEVLAHFAPELRPRIEVIPSYAPETLPDLLKTCAVGVFPSYAEGFPLGVLEMLAAAVPVVAYDLPGAPEMLDDEYLVPPKNTRAMSARLAALLRDRKLLAEARVWARERARRFTWDRIAAGTHEAYTKALEKKRAVAPSAP